MWSSEQAAGLLRRPPARPPVPPSRTHPTPAQMLLIFHLYLLLNSPVWTEQVFGVCEGRMRPGGKKVIYPDLETLLVIDDILF